MEVVHDEAMLERYVAAAVDVSPERPILIDKFLENAIEAEADAISDGKDAFVPAVMEHIELAGIHSGDSACVIPTVSIPQKHLDTIVEYTKKIALELSVVGLMNIQYAIANDVVYILEANPRASRTVPLVSKVCNVSMARIAAGLVLGGKLSDYDLGQKKIPYFGVKEAVFPFNMLPEVDPLLGPEMRSTGEVMGLADSFGLAFYKAQKATLQELPSEGTVLISVSATERPAVAPRGEAVLRTRLPDQGHQRDTCVPGFPRHRGGADQEDDRGSAQHRGWDHEQGDPPGRQHAERKAEQGG